MLKIVADSRIPFLAGALDSVAQVMYIPGAQISKEHIANADALIIRTRTKCNRELLHGTSVKFIASATIGYDHIDTAYCDAHGIKWTNAPGCNSGSVKQYIASALAQIISIEKKAFKDITLGIIGVGNVGSKVADMAKTLGIKTLLNDPPRERNEGKGAFTDIETLIAQSDIITMHVPLSHQGIDKTFHLANTDFFTKTKPGAWFINTSRGEVMETQSLINALESKRLGGAVIDVWENEPNINLRLLELAQITTPHIAGYSADGKANGTAMSVQATSKFFDLGTDNWQPNNVPQAMQSSSTINCRDKSKEQIFCELSNFAYNILLDSNKLKESVGTFEQQRENYPIRREPENLEIIARSISHPLEVLIQNLGYKLQAF
ncbi:MAG: 4-phosphoerythronate dehydrogenase [Tenuifilaceae bacterium]|jgi:erythronate-4-phosphate dehydrogenase|nr:4-phosphoerythronate dehydrogenase [Tenuifilaceae bacterium]